MQNQTVTVVRSSTARTVPSLCMPPPISCRCFHVCVSVLVFVCLSVCLSCHQLYTLARMLFVFCSCVAMSRPQLLWFIHMTHVKKSVPSAPPAISHQTWSSKQKSRNSETRLTCLQRTLRGYYTLGCLLISRAHLLIDIHWTLLGYHMAH